MNYTPFVLTNKIESVISMSRLYNCLPSVIMGIKDDYTAFCFNEACAVIRVKMDEGEIPLYQTNKKKVEVKKYKNFKDFYKQF